MPSVPTSFADLGLPAELPLLAHLAGDACDLVGERAELVDHRVDRVLELRDLAADVDGDLLREVAVRDRGGYVGDVADLVGEVAGERIDVVRQALPHAADALDLRLPAELAVCADLARDARHLVGERRELVDHRVHGRADAPELALDRLSLDRELHLLGEVAVRDRVDDARDLGGRADEVVDQRVEGLHRVDPVAGERRRSGALGEASLAADRAADTGDFLAEGMAAVRELVEGPVQVGGDPGAGGGQADLELAVPGCFECSEEPLEVFARYLLVGPVALPGGTVLGRRRCPLARPCRLALPRFDRHSRPLFYIPSGPVYDSVIARGFPGKLRSAFRTVITA